MTSGPINPKETAQAAIARGELYAAGVYERLKETQQAELKAQGCSRILLPDEAGIAAIVPPPPKPRHLYKKTIPKKSKYVITPKQLLEMGFTRQELQHIKNEVRGQ